jgi:GTP cyclohydrolase I
MTGPAPQPLRGPTTPRRLQVVHGRDGMDLEAAQRAVADLLVALGRDPASEHLADTPRRVARTRTPRCSRRASST